MTTIDLECPHCGAPGSAPKEKVHSRLVCKKCHTVFHLTPSGRAVPGEPPDPDAKHDHHHPHPAPHKTDLDPLAVPSVSRARMVAVLALALLGVGVYTVRSVPYWTAYPFENVTPKAEAVAAAIASGRADHYASDVLPGTEESASQFYHNTARRLAAVREKSPLKEIDSKVLVLEVDANQTVAQVVSYFTPKKGNAHNQQIADAVTEDLPATLTEVTLWFSKDGQGKWRLDGRRCAGVEVKPAS